MQPIWRPSREQVRDANLTSFIKSLRARGEIAGAKDGVPLPYGVLHEWSIRNREAFWRATAEFCGLVADDFDASTCIGLDRMAPPDAALGPKWFDGARLNFAENLLRHCDNRPAIVSWNERGRQQQLTFAELAGEVSRIASALRDMGVGVGDRVAGFLPNIPEAIVAMLATTTLGAVWSSCSPDFGVQGVLDRFGQIEPKVLICADGYRYAGKELDCVQRVRDIAARIPSISSVIVVPYLDGRVDTASVPRSVRWDSLRRVGTAPEFTRLPFDHPVYVMYSSGTTGLPKCMVHGAGGTLLQHLKELVLHTDLTRDDRIFYFTTCGWMMWNWMASSLAVGATVVLYDGAPLQPKPEMLWDMIEAEQVTVFGTSAKYLALAEKAGVVPHDTHDLRRLRTILSTGSPLAAHSYDYVYASIGSDIHLASISGGTDIISCFALGNPTAPVYRGEIQCRGLGMAVEAYDAAGNAVAETPGELVCTLPFPSMPVGFWNDPDGSRYRAAYFDFYPHVWRHGDWIELTRARRCDHLRTERRDAEPGRRSDRHGGDLPAGGAASGSAREHRSRAGNRGRRERRRANSAVREAPGGSGAHRRIGVPDQIPDQGEHDAAPRSQGDSPGGGHPAHGERQDHRDSGARGRSRKAGHERRSTRESGVRWSISGTGRSWRYTILKLLPVAIRASVCELIGCQFP